MEKCADSKFDQLKTRTSFTEKQRVALPFFNLEMTAIAAIMGRWRPFIQRASLTFLNAVPAHPVQRMDVIPT